MKRSMMGVATWLISTGVLLAACQSTTAVPTTEQVLAKPPSPVETAIQTSTVTSEPQITATDMPSVEEVLPTAREGLTATDPTTVSLVSGKPTLVEFFAFW
jgi:hypothetical protein